jgi:hypothetical protein
MRVRVNIHIASEDYRLNILSPRLGGGGGISADHIWRENLKHGALGVGWHVLLSVVTKVPYRSIQWSSDRRNFFLPAPIKEQAKKTYAGILKHSSVHGVHGEAGLELVRPKKRLSFNFSPSVQPNRHEDHPDFSDDGPHGSPVPRYFLIVGTAFVNSK